MTMSSRPSQFASGMFERQRKSLVVVAGAALAALAVAVTAGFVDDPADHAPAFTAGFVDDPADHAPAVLAIDPYLTDLDTHHAVFNWRTRTKVTSTLRVGTTLGLERSRVETEAGLQHRVELRDLVPDTLYHYEVAASFRGSFRTMAEIVPVRFACVGHTHGTESFGHYPDALLVNKLTGLRPDFVLHSGDTTYHANVAGFSRHFFRLFGPLLASVPVFVSPGNHDAGWPFLYGSDLRAFRELFTYPYAARHDDARSVAHYAIEKGRVLFLFLAYTSSMGPESEQRRWLREQMAAASQPFQALVFGGGNNYCDIPGFLDFAADLGVDLIINGDGAKRRPIRWHRDMLVLFSGTGSAQPHPIIWCEDHGSFLWAKVLDASGRPGPMAWLHSPKVEPAQLRPSSTRTGITGKKLFRGRRWTFDPLPSSSDVRGVQIELKVSCSRPMRAWTFVTPADARGGEVGFRSPYYSIDERTRRVTFPILSERPFDGGPYRIKEVRFDYGPFEDDNSIEIVDVYLF